LGQSARKGERGLFVGLHKINDGETAIMPVAGNFKFRNVRHHPLAARPFRASKRPIGGTGVKTSRSLRLAGITSIIAKKNQLSCLE
jgi:hypothetical protein